MSFTGSDDDVRVPANLVVSQMPATWQMLRHRLMAQLPEDVVAEVRYAQAEEIICQAVIDLEASVRQPLFESRRRKDDGGADGD